MVFLASLFRIQNILCSQTMDSVLFQVSKNLCVHQRILYFLDGIIYTIDIFMAYLFGLLETI